MMWCVLFFAPSYGLHQGFYARRRSVTMKSSEEYENPATALIGRILNRKKPLDVDFSVQKTPMAPAQLASKLEAGLKEREWFVTGRILPELFSDDFQFVDPDVSLKGVREYAEGVRTLFSEDSRAEVVSCELSEEDVLTVTWRLSGKVNVLGGLKIKPYLVYTDLAIQDGLVVSQEDRFSIPSWDILLSAFAPWLPFLAPPAPPIS